MSRRILIVLLLVFAILTGCQAAPAEPTEPAVETAYPINQGYPLEDVIINTGEDAYPVQQADLQNLYRNWVLTTYMVDGSEETPPAITLTFNEDGIFSRETEKGLTEGTWRAELTFFPRLILETNAQEFEVYNLLGLESDELRWQIGQEGMLIEEVYSPAN
ncbi:hypothetical protein KQH50_01940 [bacterium]|nr:hypothetical protein [bacterium]